MTPDASPFDADRVVAVGAVDDDLVGLSVAGACGSEVDVDFADVGSGQVVDGDQVGAAERGEVDLFDAVGVHRDVGDVAEEAQPASVRGQVDLLADVGAVELHRVGAVLAFDDVAAVAGVPDERVVAGAEEGGVVAAAAVDESLPRRRAAAPLLNLRTGCRCRPRRAASRLRTLR